MVAESELNREQLIQEWVVMTGGVRTLTNRVKFYGPIASVAALLVSGLAAVRRGKVGSSYMQPSWLQMIPKGASLLLSLSGLRFVRQVTIRIPSNRLLAASSGCPCADPLPVDREHHHGL